MSLSRFRAPANKGAYRAENRLLSYADSWKRNENVVPLYRQSKAAIRQLEGQELANRTQGAGSS